MPSRAKQARGALSYFLSLSWADQPNKALWLCSASCSLTLGYLCFSNSARSVFSVWKLYFPDNHELHLLILWSVHVELWLSNVVCNVKVTFASYMKNPTLYSPFNNESISGFNHWFRLCTHDPVTSQKPFLWALYWNTSHFISKP